MILPYPTQFLPLVLSPPLRLPPLAYVTPYQILYVITRIRLVRVGFHLPFSLNHSFRYVSADREDGRSSDTQRVQGELIEITTGVRH